jgi:L-asparaginase
MQKKSIYVAYTGGTIGMQRSENGYIPSPATCSVSWR